MSTTSAQIRALTTILDEFHAELYLLILGAQGHVITVIHETADGVLRSYDFKNDATLRDVQLSDADALYVTVRHQGDIVGCALIETRMSQVDEEGAVLCPYALQNIGFDERLLTDGEEPIRSADETTLEAMKVEVTR